MDRLMTSFELTPGQTQRPRIDFVGPGFDKAATPPNASNDVDTALKSYEASATRAAGLSLMSTLVSSVISGFRRLSQGN